MIQSDDMDRLLALCKIEMSKKGMISYTEFIEVVKKDQVWRACEQVRKSFNKYQQVRMSSTTGNSENKDMQ
jgi:uncharacterized protein YcgL (UPF0745 family)